MARTNWQSDWRYNRHRISPPVPHALTNTVDSMALLVRDNSNNEFTAVSGVVPNEIALEADYTTGGYITVDALCTGFFTEDGDGDANLTNQMNLLM